MVSIFLVTLKGIINVLTFECWIAVMCCPQQEDLENTDSTSQHEGRLRCSLYRTFIYSEQMAIRCSHCKHTTVQSLQHTHTLTHTGFIQSIAEQHIAHTRPLTSTHIQSTAEQRRHQSGVRSDKHRRKIK